jgi:hypothetical protein
LRRYETKGQQAHGGVFGGLAEEFAEGGEIAVFMKDGAPGVSSVEDMVTVTSLRSAPGAWHGRNYRRGEDRVQAKSTMSPFLVRRRLVKPVGRIPNPSIRSRPQAVLAWGRREVSTTGAKQVEHLKGQFHVALAVRIRP